MTQDAAAADAAMPPADLIPVDRRANLPYRAVRWIGIPALHAVFDIRIDGREHIPKSGPYIVIGNHLNWLDEFLLLRAFPAQPRMHFLADPTGLVRKRLQWWLVRTTGGYVPVVRARHGDQRLFHHVERALAIGAVVAMFPEGDYGPVEGQMMPFKKGFAHFALGARCPVVPTALSGTKELWLRKPVALRIGAPIAPDGHAVDSLVAAGRAAVEALLPPYVDPGGRRPLERVLTNLF